MISDNAFALIRAEAARQDAKWGDQRHLSPEMWVTILAEEQGEVARAVLDKDDAQMLRELVQVAAVAGQAIDAVIARQKARGES